MHKIRDGYQFCDCIVNYDLPWNPMRVEQRIGRIDRNGQKSESVAIVNLITPGTVDADIYERCLLSPALGNAPADRIGSLLSDAMESTQASSRILHETLKKGIGLPAHSA